MSVLRLTGADVRYERHGSGDDVVLSSAAGFDAYPAILARPPYDCTVVTVQARGFGRSSHLAEPPAAGWLDQWGEDVLAVADHLGIDTFVYTGVSHGAGIGWHLARRHPERLRALISVVGTPTTAPATPPPPRAAAASSRDATTRPSSRSSSASWAAAPRANGGSRSARRPSAPSSPTSSP